MKPTERINRINANLNKHFKSNNDAWWVSNSLTDKRQVELHRGYGDDKINPKWVAAYILRTEPTIDIVHFVGGCTAYTRTTLSWAGIKC